MFSTDGQRKDPSHESPFVWSVTSTDTYSDIVSVMSYSNWDRGQPDYAGENEACMHACKIWSVVIRTSGMITLVAMHYAMCSVCEIDIINQHADLL